MTIVCCEICLAITICSIITILFYIASWYNHEEKNEAKEEKLIEIDTSDMQGLDNVEPLPCSEPNEILDYGAEENIIIPGQQSTGEIIIEKCDLSRSQDEDLRSRLTQNESDIQPPPSDDYAEIEPQNNASEFNSVVHSDSKIGRLHLSIRYDNERSKLIVKILDAEDLIKTEQTYAPEVSLIFTLIGPYINEHDTEKHTRIVVENPAVVWKTPMSFCTTFENAIKQNLYINATNTTDPAAPRDREISITLNSLTAEADEIDQWFDLQYVQSSY